jgi:endonuclease III
MNKLNTNQLIQKIQETLAKIDFDYQEHINGLGQVCASEKRDNGGIFTINDHLKGLILAMLSNQRPWGPIANNLSKINDIFFSYDVDEIKKSDKKYLAHELKSIKCGNRRIDRQMNSLNHNIEILKNIQNDYGSIDKFVISALPDEIANQIGNGKKYKIKEIGYTLALEYLKNLGIKAIKPDVHVTRILSSERLNFFNGYPSEAEAFKLMIKMADDIKINPTYIDNLLWLFCAVNFGNICGAKPKCEVCKLKEYCNFPPNNLQQKSASVYHPGIMLNPGKSTKM